MPITFSITAVFDETATPPQLRITDTTDYAGQGVPDLTDLADKLKVTLLAADGTHVVYNNVTPGTYDIPLASTRDNQIPIYLPLDSNGDILQGTYTVQLQFWDTTTPSEIQAQDFEYLFQCPCPKVKIEATVNCAKSQVTSEDVTDYGLYVTTLSRVHKVYPPPVLELSPYVSSGATITVTGIYTQTWTSEVTSTITYTYPDGHVTIIEVSGVKEFEVVCDDDGCKILCCLGNLNKTYNRLLAKNTTAAIEMWESTIAPAIKDIQLYMLAKQCGDETKAAMYLASIMAVTGCDGKCNDCGQTDKPSYVTPVENTNNITVVDSPDLSIAVTNDVVGDTTTYHVQISDAIQTLLASMYNTTVSTDTPDYLEVVATGSNPKNYAVNYVGSNPPDDYFPYIFTPGTTQSDPGNKNLKFNNSDLFSATKLFVSNTAANNFVLTYLFLLSGQTTTKVKSVITIRKKGDPDALVQMRVINHVTVAGAWSIFDIEMMTIEASAPFVDKDDLFLSVDIIGNAGFSEKGSEILNNDCEEVNPGDTTGIDVLVKTYAIAADTLTADGDMVLAEADAENTDTNALWGNMNIHKIILTTSAGSAGVVVSHPFSSYQEKIESFLKINRYDSTTVLLVCGVVGATPSTSAQTMYITGVDFSQPITIDVYANTKVTAAPPHNSNDGIATRRLYVQANYKLS
jgi:hypothetical protein